MFAEKMAASTKRKAEVAEKMHSVKKRKNHEEKDEPEAVNTMDDEKFTAVHFKFMLRDKETAVKGLEKFIEATADEESDIITDYITSSLECSEIFEVVDKQILKPNELGLVFLCFEKILLHIAGNEDLQDYFSVGKHIVTKLLTSYMHNLMYALNMKSKAAHIKSALKLLTAMVMLSPITATLVLNNMKFGGPVFISLFERRDVQDKEDVRTCLLHLIVAFLLSGDNQVIRKLVDIKDFLEHAFQGMMYDRLAVIHLVLSTLLEKVVMNLSITKTAKVQLFTSKVLNSMGNLFTWRGPVKRKQKLQKGSTEQQVSDMPSAEVQGQVSERAYSFLVEVCTSYGHGIIFKDSTQGLSTRNNNQTVTNFLLTLTFNYNNPLATDLVVQSLSKCPEQIPFYLSHFGHKLEPQLMKSWLKYMDLICRVYESLTKEPPILQKKDPRSVEQTVNVLLLYTCPQSHFMAILQPGFKKNSIVFNHILLKMVHIFAERAVNILALVSSQNNQDPNKGIWSMEERNEIVAMYKKSVIQVLPEQKVIFDCLDVAQKNRSQADLEKLKEFTDGNEMELDARIIQTFCVYQELFPSILVDNHLVLTKLIDQVIQQETGDNYLPQLLLLKLLAGTDARRLPWAKQNKQGHTLMYQLLEMVCRLSSVENVKDTSLQFICKLLVKTGLFDGFDEELPVWVRPLQSQVGSLEDLSTLLSFVSGVLTSYMSNPYPYMDKVSDLVSEAAVLKTGRPGQSEMDNEEKFRAVVAMEIDNLDSEEDENVQKISSSSSATKRFPFCPMLLVAIEVYKKKQEQFQGLKSYLSTVVLGVFHQQIDPIVMCVQLQKCDPADLLDGVQTYILTWLPQSETLQSPKKKKKRRLESMNKELLTVRRYEDVITINPVLNQDKMSETDSVRQQLLHLTHILGQTELDANSTAKVQTVLTNIYKTIEENSTSGSRDMETSEPSSTKIPILDSTEREPVPASCIKIVLSHPIVMEYFFHDNFHSQSSEIHQQIAQQVTDLVIQLIEMMSSEGSKIGPTLDHYNDKVFNLLKSLDDYSSDQHQKILPLVFSYLKFMIQEMDSKDCLDVLNSILSIPTPGQKTNICDILSSLMVKLYASPIKQVKMKREQFTNLILWFVEAEELEKIVVLEEFISKYPTLMVLCPETSLDAMLQNRAFDRIAVMLLRNNFHLQNRFAEKWILGIDDSETLPHLPVIMEYLKILFARLTAEERKESDVIKRVRVVFDPHLLQLAGLDNSDSITALFELFQLLLQMETFDKQFIQQLEEKVFQSLRHKDTSILNIHHIQMAELLLNCPLSEHGSNVNQRLLHICFECCTNSSLKKKQRNQDFVMEVLKILSGIPKEDMMNFPSTYSEFSEAWPVFVKKSLKYLYTNPKLLAFLTKIVPIVYAETTVDVGVPLNDLVTMVMSHSTFLKVMFNEEEEECKDALVDLLLELFQLSPTSCEVSHVVIYLGAYGATLSLTDQKILKLLNFYESQGINFFDFRPYLWGEKAVEYQMLRPGDKKGLITMKMGKILSGIDPDRMYQTVLNFPLTRHLQNVNPVSAEKLRGLPTTYDPCFFLSLFSFLLAPDRYIQFKPFLDNDCLSLLFACLSSHDKALRSAAYHVLDRFQVHLQMATFQGQEELTYLLRLLRNSLTEPVSKLAPLITLFLARAARLLFQPGNHMYTVIKSFLMAKPTLDIFDIPEFYKLFNSSDVEHKTERAWVLSLMQEGLREVADFRIFEKRYSFKVLFSYYDTETADTESQIQVLQIVRSACQNITMSKSLCNEHGMLTWITAVMAKLSPEKKRHITELVNILHSLWFTMLGKVESSRDKSGHLEPVFTSQMMSLLQNILWYFRDVKKTVVEKHLKTLLSVVKHRSLILTLFRQDEKSSIPSNLTHVDLLILLLYIERVRNKDASVKAILNILSSLGYKTSLLQNHREENSKGNRTLQTINERLIAESKRAGERPDDSEMVESNRKRRKTDAAGNEVDEAEFPLRGSNAATVGNIEEEICRQLLTLILNEKCLETKSRKEELVAASMLLVEWVIERLTMGRDSDLLLDGLKYVHGIFVGNSVFTTMVCSETQTSTNIVTGLLNLYSIIYSKHVSNYNECVSMLNMILKKVAEKKFETSSDGSKSVEEESLWLRELFVTDETTTSVSTTGQTDDTSSHRKRKGNEVSMEIDPPKREKREKTVSKELKGVSQIVENLHLQKETDDDDVDDDDDDDDDYDDDKAAKRKEKTLGLKRKSKSKFHCSPSKQKKSVK